MVKNGIHSDLTSLNRRYNNEIPNWNNRTLRARIVEPVLRLLRYPIQKPQKEITVHLDEKIADISLEYIIEHNGVPKIGVKLVDDLNSNSLQLDSFDNIRCLVLTDGVTYNINILTEIENEEIGSLHFTDFNDNSYILEFLSINSVINGLFDSTINNYENVLNDNLIVNKNQNELSEKVVDQLDEEFHTVPNNIIKKGAEHMMDYINREITSTSFEDIFEETKTQNEENSHDTNNRNIENIDIKTMDPDDLVIIVKDTKKNINQRINVESAQGQLVTYKEDKPDYVAFYPIEDENIGYISEIETFELIDTKDNDEFANKVFEMELNNIKYIEDPIEDEFDILDSISYARANQLLGIDDISNANLE